MCKFLYLCPSACSTAVFNQGILNFYRESIRSNRDIEGNCYFGLRMLITESAETRIGRRAFKNCWFLENHRSRRLFYCAYKSVLNVIGWENELSRFCTIGRLFLPEKAVPNALISSNQPRIKCPNGLTKNTQADNLCAERQDTCTDDSTSSTKLPKDLHNCLFVYIFSQIYSLIKYNSENIEELLLKDHFNEFFVRYDISQSDHQAAFMYSWKLIVNFDEMILTSRSLASEAFDSAVEAHESSLMQLWNHLRPNSSLSGRISEDWKGIGFQGKDPATDFRGMGILGLRQLVEFCGSCEGKIMFCALTNGGNFYFPFCIAGINITNAIMNLPKKQLFVLYLSDCLSYEKGRVSEPSCLGFLNRLYEQIWKSFLEEWKLSDRNISNFNSLLQQTMNKL